MKPVMRQVAEHVAAGTPTTDQKVRGSNPFGRTTHTLALTSTTVRAGSFPGHAS